MFSRFFIQRPIFAIVIAVAMILAGALTFSKLPISQFPDITPPTVMVSASYPGADANTVAETVGVPIEQLVNGVEGMMYMSSESGSDGSYMLTITFEEGTDIDNATVKVQNRVAQADPQLPTAVKEQGVTVSSRSSDMILMIALQSPDTARYDALYLTNYANLHLTDELSRIDGVGSVEAFGGGTYSMRVWLDPEKMRVRGISSSDVMEAITSQNMEVSAGSVGAPPDASGQQFEFTLTAQGRLASASEFGNIVVRANPDGSMLRLRDIGTVELGSNSYSMISHVSGESAGLIGVYQLPGSNALAVANAVEDKLDELQQYFPEHVNYRIILNTTDFVTASIDEVIVTFIETTLIVMLVIMLFLQNWRAVVIPMLTVPVSLIATFAVMKLMGFTLNTLTLFGLVLAIAIVVDDAIVVVEAVHAKLDQGYKSARQASIDAMDEIAGALISITLVMMLVFIPVSFMPGTAGVFYQQFGITMAVAIGFSAVNALTLSPALCALFLKPHTGDDSSLKERMGKAYQAAGEVAVKRVKRGIGLNFPPIVTILLLAATIYFMIADWFAFENVLESCIAVVVALLTVAGLFGKRFQNAFEKGYGKLLGGYKKVVKFVNGHKITAFGTVVVAVIVLVWLMARTPSAMVPNEDTGFMFGMVDMPAGTSQERTTEVLDSLENIVMANPAVNICQTINGYSFIAGQGATYGTLLIKLKNWSERHKGQDINSVIQQLYGASSRIKDGRVIFIAPPMITGYSVTNGFELKMQDKTGGDINQFFAVTQAFLGQLNQQPEIQVAYTTFNPTFPQYMIDIDAAKCKQAGISPATILQTLQGYYGGMYVSNFNRFGKIYRVMMQAAPEARINPETLNSVKIRNGNEMASISNFVKLTRVYGPDLMNRFNMFTSISVTGTPNPGFSSGEAIAAIERVAAQTLPQGYAYEYAGMTREEAGSGSSNATAMIFGLCLLFVYLLLSAQYESYLLPFSVILSVPFGLAGTFIFAQMFGISNNIYLQIALIMLIGLLAKNAILIVEFALERRQTGMSVFNAAIAGACARLRPILMTSLAMVIGLLPMMFASGVGANGNRALGAGSVGGMLLGMICQIFIVPALFIVFQLIQEKFKPIKWQNEEKGGTIENEIEQYAK